MYYIQVKAHYFEDGNIQLNTVRPTESTVLSNVTAASSDVDIAKAVIAYIDVSILYVAYVCVVCNIFLPSILSY